MYTSYQMLTLSTFLNICKACWMHFNIWFANNCSWKTIYKCSFTIYHYMIKIILDTFAYVRLSGSIFSNPKIRYLKSTKILEISFKNVNWFPFYKFHVQHSNSNRSICRLNESRGEGQKLYRSFFIFFRKFKMLKWLEYS